MTRKITMSLARIRHGRQDVLELGNLDAKRDWGYAPDYVRGMWMMLQREQGDDFVLATGVNHTVRQFVTMAAEAAGFALTWEGEDEHTVGIEKTSGRTVVCVNPEFYRPAEVDELLGDAGKARQELGWQPQTAFPELVESMMRADLDRAAAGRI